MSQISDINIEFNDKLTENQGHAHVIIELWYNILGAVEYDSEDIIDTFEYYKEIYSESTRARSIMSEFDKHIDYEKRVLENEKKFLKERYG